MNDRTNYGPGFNEVRAARRIMDRSSMDRRPSGLAWSIMLNPEAQGAIQPETLAEIDRIGAYIATHSAEVAKEVRDIQVEYGSERIKRNLERQSQKIRDEYETTRRREARSNAAKKAAWARKYPELSKAWNDAIAEDEHRTVEKFLRVCISRQDLLALGWTAKQISVFEPIIKESFQLAGRGKGVRYWYLASHFGVERTPRIAIPTNRKERFNFGRLLSVAKASRALTKRRI